MRNDAIGLFWEDLPPPPKQKVERVKREPPEPVWLNDDYLPYLDEAKRFPFELYTDDELIALTEPLLYDVEVYSNYFLVVFRGIHSDKVIYFESFDDYPFNQPKLKWLLENKQIIGFNSRKYDIVILAIAVVEGFGCKDLYAASDQIINMNMQPWEVLKKFKVPDLQCDHIDIKEVAPLFASLKIYGGRLGTKRMQDLPFPPDRELNEDQRDIVRLYCVNDLQQTKELTQSVSDDIDLRVQLSNEYQIDLRSKSDAQIAEAVIGKAIESIQGKKPNPPQVNSGFEYYFKTPEYMQHFSSDEMRYVLNLIQRTPFTVNAKGKIGLPKVLEKLKIPLGFSKYKMGIGGLHSTESKTYHLADENYILEDRDVTSYYPFIIINQGLYPTHIGPDFIHVYKGIVDRRIEAKRTGDKATAASLKITINGSFGKFGSPFSILYTPELVVQTTISGQLSLLLLIEKLEQAGISVVSANTDGIVIKCPRNQVDEYHSIVEWWEQATNFQTEVTEYSALYSRDVNNYIGIQPDGSTKTKGVFANPGLSKNPANRICIEAATNFLVDGTPVRQTIIECDDIKQFVTVRTAKGGAVWRGEYLGSAIRWYRSVDGDEIVYAKNGNRVAGAASARPAMNLPDSLPDDLDFDWYEAETYKILDSIGVSCPQGREAG